MLSFKDLRSQQLSNHFVQKGQSMRTSPPKFYNLEINNLNYNRKLSLTAGGVSSSLTEQPAFINTHFYKQGLLFSFMVTLCSIFMLFHDSKSSQFHKFHEKIMSWPHRTKGASPGPAGCSRQHRQTMGWQLRQFGKSISEQQACVYLQNTESKATK